VIDTDDAKAALAHGMGARWQADLVGDGVAPARATALVDASWFVEGSVRQLIRPPQDDLFR
jgi:hypothetical protein